MSHDDKKELPPTLAAHVAAMNVMEASESDVQSAQQKLEAAVTTLSVTRRSTTRRWLFAATTAFAIAVISLLPIFGDHNGVAFAQVQKHFLDFQTMAFTVEQRFSGQLQLTTRVQMNRAGDVRTDVDKSISVILGARQKKVLTLMHEAHEAMQFDIDVAPVANTETTEWLKEVQAYKDVATPLPNTRIIDGKTAHGWVLTIKGMRTEIWADDDGIPMAMTMVDGNTMDLRFRFKLDPPMAADTFSTDIPGGYTRVQPDE